MNFKKPNVFCLVALLAVSGFLIISGYQIAQAATLTGTNVEPASLIAGTTNQVTVIFHTISVIPPGGKVKVTFGAGFNVTGAALGTCSTFLGDTGTTTSVSSQVVTITRVGGTATVADHNEICTINGIVNPVSAGSTGLYEIETTDASDVLIDDNVAVTADTIISAPTISNISPTSGSTAGGTSLTITGTGFATSTVTIGGNPATVTASSATSLTVTTPSSRSAGLSNIIITNEDTGEVSTSTAFTYTVKEVSSVEDSPFLLTVPYGTVFDDIGLPATTTVILSDDSTTTVTVTWDEGASFIDGLPYDGATSTTYFFIGTLSDLPGGVTNPSDVTAEATVIVDVNPYPNFLVTAIDSIDDINVAYGTTLANIGLPTTATTTIYSSSSHLTIGISGLIKVNWDTGKPTYNSHVAGSYVFTGILDLSTSSMDLYVASGSPTFTNPDNLTASTTVIVAELAVPVTGISLNNISQTLTVGASYQLVATISPDNATDKNVTWSSNNSSVATVSGSGLITAVSAGSAIITVTTENNSFTATDTLTIIANETPVVFAGSGGGSGAPIINGLWNGLYILGEGTKAPARTPLITTNSNGVVSTTSSSFKFTSYLRQGTTHASVKMLQERLRAEGFFTYPTSTGYFGSITLKAVKAYQKAHGIINTGYVGPLTIAELNK